MAEPPACTCAVLDDDHPVCELHKRWFVSDQEGRVHDLRKGLPFLADDADPDDLGVRDWTPFP
jgi:hypothetical protein